MLTWQASIQLSVTTSGVPLAGGIMQVCINQFITQLRHQHGIITIAVQWENDDPIDHAVPSNIRVITLADGHVVYVTRAGDDTLAEFLGNSGVVPKCWIQLREYDELIPEYVGHDALEGRYIEIKAGMLDDLFGYVAVQAQRPEDILETLVDFRLYRDTEQLMSRRLTANM